MSQKIQFGATPLTAANTARNGTGSALVVYTALSRVYLNHITFQPLGNCVATVARVFVNNGSDPEVAANNVLIGEITLPSVTASEVAALASQNLPLGIYIDRSYRILVTIGTAVSAGYDVTVIPGVNQ